MRPQRTQEQIDASNLRQVVSRIKIHAGNTILAKYPTWKQTNMCGRSIEILAARESGEATLADLAEGDLIKAAFAEIKTIRQLSNAIELAAQPNWTMQDIQTAFEVAQNG
jgi:hypothetical protein